MSNTTTSKTPSDPIDPLKLHFHALHRLVERIDDFDRDPAFPLHPDQQRRVDRRHPFLTEIVIVKFEPHESELEAFRFVRGQTLSLSRVGISFSANEEVMPGKYTALINHPNCAAPNHSFHVTVLWTRKSPDGESWEHGGVLQQLDSSVAE